MVYDIAFLMTFVCVFTTAKHTFPRAVKSDVQNELTDLVGSNHEWIKR